MPCQPDCCLPAVTMFGDFLYLQSTGQDVAHAQQQDGIGGAGTVPFGEIGTIGTDYSPGFRVGGSVKCGPCTQVMTSYTWYESDSIASLDPPTGTTTGAVGSLVHHPGAALTASVGPVDATYEIDFQLAEVAWRRVVMHQPRYNLGFLCGVEYGHLEQGFAQNGVFGGGLGGAIDTVTNIKFDGGGIKVGVDGDHSFAHGLGIYARATAAALTGRFNSHYSMFNETTDQMLAMADWKDDRVIGRFEYEVGASCTSMNGCWRVAAGYMFSYWTNAVTTPEFIDAVQADNYTNVGDTLGFNGLVGRVECRY
ncbi:MAG: Lpg1974 family pore-forming outer membrane protein [Pirellulales bacterium]